MACAGEPPLEAPLLPRLMHLACRANSAEACAVIGSFYVAGVQGLPRDEERGDNLLRRACLRGSPLGCHRIGVRAAGKGRLVDAERAFHRACQLRDIGSCLHGAALLKAAGRDGAVKKILDDARGICSDLQVGGKVCKTLNHGLGVVSVATIMERWRVHVASACTERHGELCPTAFTLGVQYVEGDTVAADLAKGRKLLESACYGFLQSKKKTCCPPPGTWRVDKPSPPWGPSPCKPCVVIQSDEAQQVACLYLAGLREDPAPTDGLCDRQTECVPAQWVAGELCATGTLEQCWAFAERSYEDDESTRAERAAAVARCRGTCAVGLGASCRCLRKLCDGGDDDVCRRAAFALKQGYRAAVQNGRRLLTQKKWAQAVDAFAGALDADLEGVAALSGIGSAALGFGNLELAEAVLLRALDIEGEARRRAEVWLILGSVYEAAGDKTEAIGAYRSGIGDSRTPALEERLKRIRAEKKK